LRLARRFVLSSGQCYTAHLFLPDAINLKREFA
jgi:hypothetical protein